MPWQLDFRKKKKNVFAQKCITFKVYLDCHKNQVFVKVVFCHCEMFGLTNF